MAYDEESQTQSNAWACARVPQHLPLKGLKLEKTTNGSPDLLSFYPPRASRCHVWWCTLLPALFSHTTSLALNLQVQKHPIHQGRHQFSQATSIRVTSPDALVFTNKSTCICCPKRGWEVENRAVPYFQKIWTDCFHKKTLKCSESPVGFIFDSLRLSIVCKYLSASGKRIFSIIFETWYLLCFELDNYQAASTASPVGALFLWWARQFCNRYVMKKYYAKIAALQRTIAHI